MAILRPHYQRDWIACISVNPTGLVWAVLAGGNGSKMLLGAQGGCTHTSIHAQCEPGGGHTWEEADSSALIKLDYRCSPTAETNGCWLSNELPPRLHGCSDNHPAGQGPPPSPGRLQRSPAEWEMHNCIMYSQLLKVSTG